MRWSVAGAYARERTRLFVGGGALERDLEFTYNLDSRTDSSNKSRALRVTRL